MYARTLSACTIVALLPAAAHAQYSVTWSSFTCGGGISAGGQFLLQGTIGTPTLGTSSGGSYGVGGGFQTGAGGGGLCYANCDQSTSVPFLNVADFGCFLNKFASGDPYANCDGSTNPPVLNVADFGCFLNKFAAGCP